MAEWKLSFLHSDYRDSHYFLESPIGERFWLGEDHPGDWSPVLAKLNDDKLKKAIERIKEVAKGCAAGGHTSRARMLEALATEFDKLTLS